MMQVRWRINLFGQLSAERGEHRIAHFKTNKTGILLACLAHEPHRRFRRDELIEQLWPGDALEQGRNNLRVSLAFLRQALEPDAEERGAVLAADREVVYLNDDSFVTDSEDFEQRLKTAAEQADDACRIVHLQGAVQMYQAEFLLDFDAPWISAERLRLADAYHGGMAALALAHAGLNQLDHALAAAQISLRAAPHREETHRLMMQIHALMGRPHAALRQYRELDAMLGAEMGASPSNRTKTSKGAEVRIEVKQTSRRMRIRARSGNRSSPRLFRIRPAFDPARGR